MITKEYLVKAYIQDKKSARQISSLLGCSENKVTYWLRKYSIKKRSISDAAYISWNPNGHPFAFQPPKTHKEWFLYGLGLGLYWGEGNKANKNTIRLGNSDPALVKTFIDFLTRMYRIDQTKLKFGLQIFSDTSPAKALTFWSKRLGIPKSRFYKPLVTKSGKVGNYKKKNEHGVLTVYFSNTRLRDMIVSAIEELQKIHRPP